MPGREPAVNRRIADVLPRRSGELTFESEWERRAFGMALALIEQGRVSFDDFRWRVVAAIAGWEGAHRGQEEQYRFYDSWLLALEGALRQEGLLSEAESGRGRPDLGAGEERPDRPGPPGSETLEQQDTVFIQFLQHAHHRVEGWLMDFQEGLDQGTVDAERLERAAEGIRQHMYVEEELVFPLVSAQRGEPVAELQDDHGRIWDLTAELKGLAGDAAPVPRVRSAASRLMGKLAAHSAKEDLGVYLDLLVPLGPDRARVLLQEADRARAPTGWVCARRRTGARGER